MSFLDELKQRKVVRVAAVYLVAAWLVVQVASIALPAFDAPPWVLRVVILFAALGFPFALMLAWALDLTPEGLRFVPGGAGTRRIALIAVALALLALIWFFHGQPAPGPGAVVAKAPAATTATRPVARSIAVLPFVNMSGDPANDYFSDGLAETTLDMLAQVPDLDVVARTSSFAFKGKATDVRKIGAALGAATVLEGSVQQAGDTLRITTQLVRTSDGFHLWSHHFDRGMKDLFKVQDEVATEVVRALEISLPAPDRQRLTQKRTENVAAYQEYLRGIALLPNRKIAEMRQAAQYFENAIRIDPDYADAYVGAAEAYSLLATYDHIEPDQARRMHTYLDRALTLAPNLGEAHVLRAAFAERTLDFAEAEREFQRGIELAPSYTTGFQWYGEFLGGELYDFAGQERVLRRAVRLDPLSPIVQDTLIFALIASNQFEQAHAELAKLQRDHPDFAEGYMTGATLAAAQGDLPAMLRAIHENARRDSAALRNLLNGCRMLERWGLWDEASRCIDDLARRFPDDSLRGARVELTGQRDGPAAALAELGQAKSDQGFKAYLLLCLNRNAEALELLRTLWPPAFVDRPSAPYPSQIGQTLLAALALTRNGATAKGRALLQQALTVITTHPVNRAVAGRSWAEVAALTFLGDRDRAIAALARGIAQGPPLDIAMLDAEPLLEDLRRDPRYEATIAPARARVAAQVKAAVAAGLLQPSK